MKQPDNHPWRKALKAENSGPPKGQFGPGNQPVKGEIKVEKLQAAFKRSGLSKCEVARRLGLFRKIPNVHRLNQILGLEPNGNRKQQRVTYETAKKLCEALGASPFELGI